MDNTTDKQESGIASWRELKVWQKAHGLVLEVYKITRQFPSDERFRLTDQLWRAAISVPTNIAEGKGRFSAMEYANFVSIARGSTEETRYLLLLAKDLKYITDDAYTDVSTRYEEVGKMLYALTRSLRK